MNVDSMHFVLQLICDRAVHAEDLQAIAQATLDGSSVMHIQALMAAADEGRRRRSLNPTMDSEGVVHEQIDDRDDGRILVMRCDARESFTRGAYHPELWVDCPECIARRVALHGKARP